MEVPHKSHEMQMVLITMEGSWAFCWKSGFPLCFRGVIIGLPWDFLPQDFHRISEFAWNLRGALMGLPWYFRDVLIGVSWEFRTISMRFPRGVGVSMGLPWDFHFRTGALVVPPWGFDWTFISISSSHDDSVVLRRDSRRTSCCTSVVRVFRII